MTRTNEGGQVTIIVTWQGRAAGPIFAVEMDTHAVDLDSYNLRQLAVTYWFYPAPHPGPYPVTVRFSGHLPTFPYISRPGRTNVLHLEDE